MTHLVLFPRIILTVKCFYKLMMLNFSATMLFICNRVWINSQKWLKLHQLDLAVAKCEHLCISRIYCSNSFFAGSLNIKTVSVIKDLGIYISNNHKWCHHISHIHHNASLRSHQILRSYSTKNIWILLKAFNT